MTQSTQGERLEEVRKALGIRTIKRFHQALLEGDESDPSYNAAKLYHSDRTKKGVPAHYLAKVSSAFGVNLDWLVTGRGPMWRAEIEQYPSPAYQLVRARSESFFRHAPPPAISAFQYAWSTVQLSIPDWPSLSQEERAEVGHAILTLAEQPLRRLFKQNSLGADQQVLYYQAMFQAIVLATPGREQGSTYPQLMDRLKGEKPASWADRSR
jgi:hypothetical protein